MWCIARPITRMSATHTIRIGKKTDRPRLVKVTLSSKEEKINVLRSQRNLRNKPYQQGFRNTRLKTPQQRRNKQLCTKLAELNKTNKYYMIKQGRIVMHLSMSNATTPLPGLLGDLTFRKIKYSTHTGRTGGQISVYYGWNAL